MIYLHNYIDENGQTVIAYKIESKEERDSLEEKYKVKISGNIFEILAREGGEINE